MKKERDVKIYFKSAGGKGKTAKVSNFELTGYNAEAKNDEAHLFIFGQEIKNVRELLIGFIPARKTIMYLHLLKLFENKSINGDMRRK